MARIELSVTIKQPVEEVFAFTTDIKKASQWMGEDQETKKPSEGPVGVGTRFITVLKLLGRGIEVKQEVIEYELNRKFRFKGTSEGPIRSTEAEFTFKSVKGGTKITVAAEREGNAFFKDMIKSQWEANLANLKKLLEPQAEGNSHDDSNHGNHQENQPSK